MPIKPEHRLMDGGDIAPIIQQMVNSKEGFTNSLRSYVTSLADQPGFLAAVGMLTGLVKNTLKEPDEIYEAITNDPPTRDIGVAASLGLAAGMLLASKFYGADAPKEAEEKGVDAGWR